MADEPTNKDDTAEAQSVSDTAQFVYKPLGKPAKVFLVLSIIQCSFSALAILNFVAIFVSAMNSADGVTKVLAEFSIIVDMLTRLFHVSACIVFIVWLRRAFRNLRAFDVKEMATRSWHCIFGWLIPIVNLFLPMLAVNEIWKASDPQASLTDWHNNRSSKRIIACWILYGINGIVQLATRIFDKLAREMGMQELAHLVGVPLFFLNELLFIATGILFILVVHSITSRQERKYAVIEDSSK